jgi:hypothetical protein
LAAFCKLVKNGSIEKEKNSSYFNSRDYLRAIEKSDV